MEGQNFVVNGGIKMPIGYRFHPTDEELVFHYLKRKVLNLPLPASVIPEFDVFQTDPWSLPGDGKERKYFFSNKSYGKCKRISAGSGSGSGSGYWKPIGKEKPILATGTNLVIGIRKALVFCEGRRSSDPKTRWLLHQFRLYSTQISKSEWLGDWSVFKVIQRKRRAKKHSKSQTTSISSSSSSAVHMPSCCIDFTVEDSSVFGSPPRPTSPSSSEITEVSPNGLLLDQEESSAVIGSFSHYCMGQQ